MTRLIPTEQADTVGDLPDPWEAFLDGELDFNDLPPEDQARARALPGFDSA